MGKEAFFKEERKYFFYKNLLIFFLTFLFLFQVTPAQEILSQIEGRINGFSSVFYLISSNECTINNSDYLDIEVPPKLDEFTAFYSIVGNKNLSIDCWNPKTGPRNLSLVYEIYSPANETGNLSFFWNPSDFYSSSYRLNAFLLDLTTNQRINLLSQSSVSFSNNERKREMTLETYYEWCGDNIKNLNEQCDGSDLSGKSCVSLGYAGGQLSCNQLTCRFNTTGCYTSEGEYSKDDGSGSGGGGGSSADIRCVDECTIGSRECFSNDSLRVCGNFDNDPCSEWGPEEKCLGISPFCKSGFCYGCLSDKDCGKDSFCINGKCESNCDKSCKDLGFECGKYFFCGKILDCGECLSGFCNKGVCSNIPENAHKIREDICDPDYICSPWSDCKVSFDFENVLLGREWFRGKKERLCFDKNKCYSTIKEKEDCIIKKEIFTKKINICNKEYIEVYDKNTNELLARLTDSRYTKKSIIEIFLLPRPLVVCEEERENYKMSFFDKLMSSLNLRQIWKIVK